MIQFLWKNLSLFAAHYVKALYSMHNYGCVDRITILIKELPVGCLLFPHTHTYWLCFCQWCLMLSPADWFSSVLFVVLIYLCLNLLQDFKVNKFWVFNTMIVNSKCRFKTKNCLLLYFVLCKWLAQVTCNIIDRILARKGIV